MNERQLYRMRAPASGREAIAPAEPGQVYVDRETGEEMEPVAMVLPLAPSASSLPRAPENLRACRRCDQLIGLDVSPIAPTAGCVRALFRLASGRLSQSLSGELDREKQNKRQIDQFIDRRRQNDQSGGDPNRDGEPPVPSPISDKRFHRPDDS